MSMLPMACNSRDIYPFVLTKFVYLQKQKEKEMKCKVSLLYYLMLIGLVTFSCKKTVECCDQFEEELVDVKTLEQLEALTQSGVALLFFHATWCSRCKAQRPAVLEARNDNRVKNRLFFGEVDYEKAKPIVERMNVPGFPHIIILKNGEIVERLNGSNNTAEQIVNRLLFHLG